MDLTSRQKLLLKIIVEQYILTATPVGSAFIVDNLMKRHRISISSATIRNEASALEKFGLLEKNYSSSGRIPSTKGYRFYLNQLMPVRPIKNDQLRLRLAELFHDRSLVVNDILEKSAEIISEITNLTTIVTRQTIDSEYLKRLELIPLSKDSAVVVLITNTGNVINKVFVLKHNSMSDLTSAINMFNQRLAGTLLSELEEKMRLLAPLLTETIKNYDYILKKFLDILIEAHTSRRNIHGYRNLLDNPEFNDANKIKTMIKFIEKNSPFLLAESNEKKLNKSMNENGNFSLNKLISVRIGNEISRNYEDLAIISAKIQTDSNASAALTLVGPKRIQYEKVINLLNWIISEFSKTDTTDT